jgi:thiamine-monophosphate kinase
VKLGIGDDAAVLAPAGADSLVWTSDACVEGVHFDSKWLGSADVGFRSLQAAASDVAAMGARPLAALSNLILPASFGKAELSALARGQAEASRALGCPVVGGNLSRGAELSITTTVLGTCRQPLVRSGARPGDELWLVGDVGLAAAGLELLRAGIASRSRAAARCIRAWRRPVALVRTGMTLARYARAALDVSDGLRADAPRLADASGVRVIIEEAAFTKALDPALTSVARVLRVSPVELALTGGEDYALLAAGPSGTRPRSAQRIGRIERGRAAWFERADGQRLRLSGGFDHLSRE